MYHPSPSAPSQRVSTQACLRRPTLLRSKGRPRRGGGVARLGVARPEWRHELDEKKKAKAQRTTNGRVQHGPARWFLAEKKTDLVSAGNSFPARPCPAPTPYLLFCSFSRPGAATSLPPFAPLPCAGRRSFPYSLLPWVVPPTVPRFPGSAVRPVAACPAPSYYIPVRPPLSVLFVSRPLPLFPSPPLSSSLGVPHLLHGACISVHR